MASRIRLAPSSDDLHPDLLVIDFRAQTASRRRSHRHLRLDQRALREGQYLAHVRSRPTEWPELFGDPLLASPGLDRLGRRATLLTITGRSYRLAQRASTAWRCCELFLRSDTGQCPGVRLLLCAGAILP